MSRPSRRTPALPEVHFSDYADVRSLHLGSIWIQGSMRLDAPDDIELEYVQRMMAWLLFVDAPSVMRRHAMQLGLGAGALTKFSRRKLRMRTTAVELNPAVVHACRGWFKLPADDARLSVIVADAAAEIRKPKWAGTVDALQVDLYDDEAAAPVLDSADFYRDCRALLTDEGCMTVNLFGRDASYVRSLEQISEAFGETAVWAFRPTREGNTVVLAQHTVSRPDRATLIARADTIQARWGLPAPKWLRVFKPVIASLD
ncbi:spermidine synthase [Xylophilus sp. GOD-11R]|uniref:spermidine synthase n=1 Tax=Xylophilus sp. GOD-11R TaxID=3089814 RepID=UPI00298CF04F|nr:spermidine synthase [Xylophilus sp. GOD-11R]WPB56048.1 spermidine synthase [Xylophilus sp. GOD-11R]